jgi:hypothetical protein
MDSNTTTVISTWLLCHLYLDVVSFCLGTLSSLQYLDIVSSLPRYGAISIWMLYNLSLDIVLSQSVYYSMSFLPT